VQGTKETKEVDGTQANTTKLEYSTTLYMEEMDIDAYLIQETCLEGDVNHWNINGDELFHPRTGKTKLE
jgi:hypothetical protein